MTRPVDQMAYPVDQMAPSTGHVSFHAQWGTVDLLEVLPRTVACHKVQPVVQPVDPYTPNYPRAT